MGTKLYKVIFFILGLGTLAYMVYALGPMEIWNSLQKIGWWFLPVLLSWLLIYLMNAFAFQAIIREKENPETKLPFGKVFQLTVTGFAINYITPFVALGGEPYRIMELKSYVGGAKAGSSVVLYNMMHVLSHLIFWVLSVGLIIAFVPISQAVLWACILILGMAVLLIWWFSRIYKRGIGHSIFGALGKLPWIGPKMLRFATEREELLADMDVQVQQLFGPRRRSFYTALTWEFLGRLVGCVEIYLIARALDIEMTYVEALVVSSGSSLFANLIFFFPMQLGTREGGMAMAMVSVGYAAGVGIFIGMATRIRELVWIAIGLLMMLFSKKKQQDKQ